MKRFLFCAFVSLIAAGASAKDIKTVVFQPSPKLTCEKCEAKTKSTLRFVKGTKSIETSVKENTVTVTYDADKATLADYEKAFKSYGREVKVKEQPKKVEKKKK